MVWVEVNKGQQLINLDKVKSILPGKKIERTMEYYNVERNIYETKSFQIDVVLADDIKIYEVNGLNTSQEIINYFKNILLK